MTPRNKNLILNPVFLAGLLLLALNDHFLKYEYGNWLTGKLSDFAGLLIFPLFLAYVFPRQARGMTLITGIFFIFWKSPYSTSLIILYNKITPIAITRTVDYSDLLALAVLPVSHYLIQNIDRYAFRRLPFHTHLTQLPFHSRLIQLPFRLHPVWLIAPCSLIFMATEPPTYYRSQGEPKGDIYLNKTYHLRLTPQQVLDTLTRMGYHARPDTSYHSRSKTGPFYIIEHIHFPESADTLKSIQFQLTGDSVSAYLTVNNINLERPVNLGNWRMLKLYTRWYKYKVKKYIIEEVKKS